MVWIAALALAALNTQVSQRNEISCDLAPFVGGGSSSEGDLDSLNGIGLGCNVVLYDGGAWTLGPRVDFIEQRWSVFRDEEGTTYFNSYQARTLGLGLNIDYNITEQWNLAYTLGFSMGQGEQDQNISTPSSTQNLHLTGMSQRALRHEFLVTRRMNERLSFLAGVQWDNAQQSWDAAAGRLEREDVAPGNKLTLTSGTGADIEGRVPQSADYQALSFKIGVQMKVYSTL
jgi:hypothetical protein